MTGVSLLLFVSFHVSTDAGNFLSLVSLRQLRHCRTREVREAYERKQFQFFYRDAPKKAGGFFQSREIMLLLFTAMHLLRALYGLAPQREHPQTWGCCCLTLLQN